MVVRGKEEPLDEAASQAAATAPETGIRKRRPATYEEANEQQQPSASKAKRRSTYQGQVEGGRTKHRLDKSRRGGRQPKRFDDGGIADASPAKPPALAYGNGPPAPPQIGNDGTPIAAAPPRANDPGFVNRLNASQKNAQLKQRVRQLKKADKEMSCSLACSPLTKGTGMSAERRGCAFQRVPPGQLTDARRRFTNSFIA